MYLLVDNSDFEFTKLYIDLNNNWVQRDWVASCPLAVCIQEFLNEQNVSLKQLKGLGVVVGRGRFTATRVAVTVVNTLAYSFGEEYIKKNDEIFYDYAMVMNPDERSNSYFKMDCECGSKKCRKVITEDDWEIPQLQKKYNGYYR